LLFSVLYAALSAMRRAPHEGQILRRLQENANSLVALLSLSAWARYPGLRIPPLFQDHSNVLFPNFEPCSKGSGHLNNPLYNLR
jgi:hypothetical protein